MHCGSINSNCKVREKTPFPQSECAHTLFFPFSITHLFSFRLLLTCLSPVRVIHVRRTENSSSQWKHWRYLTIVCEGLVILSTDVFNLDCLLVDAVESPAVHNTVCKTCFFFQSRSAPFFSLFLFAEYFDKSKDRKLSGESFSTV